MFIGLNAFYLWPRPTKADAEAARAPGL
jgi:hypothetical protein